MVAAARFNGNLRRSQVDELERQNPNTVIDSHWINTFVKGLVEKAIDDKCAKISIDAKKEEMKELELLANIFIKKIQKLNNM